MSLSRRVAVMTAAVALLCAMLGYFVHDALGTSTSADDSLARRWAPAARTATTLLTHLVDQETGERGFVLTGEGQFLEPYADGRTGATRDVARLRQLLADQPRELAALTATVDAAETWRTQAAEPEIAARRRGGDQVERLAALGLGKELFDRVRMRAGALQDVIEARRLAAQRAVGAANDSLRRWHWASAGASVLIGAVVLLSLLFWVLRPLGRLSTAMRRVTAGDLDADLTVVGPPEIAQVSADADAMRRRLLVELERSESARQALEQRGPVVLGLSQQLAAQASGPIPGLRYASALRPAEGVLAGDWVDVVPIGHDRVAVMLLDVSGHGAAAGLEAMRLKTVLTSALMLGHQPHEAMALAAAGFSDDERFATAVIVTVDLVSGQLRWSNAGHPGPRLVDLRSTEVRPDETPELHQTGPLLSSMTSGWTTRNGRLEVGQILLAFSDGLTEARDSAGRQFGVEGICAALSQTTVRDVDTAVSVCVAAARAYATDLARDDVTVVAVARDPGSLMPALDDDVRAAPRTRDVSSS